MIQLQSFEGFRLSGNQYPAYQVQSGVDYAPLGAYFSVAMITPTHVGVITKGNIYVQPRK